MNRKAYVSILALISLAISFPDRLQFDLETCSSSSSGRFDRGDERKRAKRDGRHPIYSAAGGDGDDRRIADERRDGDVYGSGVGSERHLRGWNEYGNGYNQRERRGHLDGVHGEYDGRRLYGDGLGCRSVDTGQLQSHEHSRGCCFDHGDERNGAKRGDQHGVCSAAGGDGAGQLTRIR